MYSSSLFPNDVFREWSQQSRNTNVSVCGLVVAEGQQITQPAKAEAFCRPSAESITTQQ